MCVNFTDLNKYCPKDFYPLPSTDQKIIDVSRHEVLNFLDLHKVYNQVLMGPEDTPKVTFITN